MYLLSFLDPCMSKLNAGLAIASNSNCSNTTFYRDPGRHPSLHCLTQSSQWHCEVDDVVTLTQQRRKPEFPEVQSRAKILTGSFDCKLELLWFEHHHGECLPFDCKNTYAWGQLSRAEYHGKSPPQTYVLLSAFLGSAFFSAPFLGLCYFHMDSHFSFLSSFISSLHTLRGSEVLLVAWH